ncbi:hypothetical protein [Halobacteriovorax sp. HLS]|uniref:hypothetical protein n=1 Tax=Halobacteriovorax sp. HLS TaxID=2234000 RepID=UPI000FDA634E|nr:hypothetical protein [Halobacteriovorax sp. HLS]
MRWQIGKNVIQSIFYKNQNLINPWGVETSDTSSFYSLEDGIGYRYKVEDEKQIVKESSHEYGAKILMKDGAFNIKLIENLDDAKVSRKLELEVLEDIPLMDFVLRFRFKDKFFPTAKIAAREFSCDNSNLYHMYPTDRVELFGEKYQINLQVKKFQAPSGFEQNMYVRSRHGEWIVHARMIPNRSDKEVIKLCSKWFMTRPLPQWLTNFLLYFKPIKNCLWYRGEKNPFKSRIINIFNPNAFPMIELKKGEVLKWEVECEISER